MPPFPRRPPLPALGLALAALLLVLHPAPAPAQSAAPAASGTSAPTPVHLTRAETRALQRALRVPADGVFGPRTRAALRRVEARAGLPVDGVPDTAVLAVLGITPAAVPAPSVGDGNGAQVRSAAVAAALSQIGVPYRPGGRDPRGFDCSGLTAWAFGRTGLALGPSSFAQAGVGVPVARRAIRRGDLVLFDTNGPGPSDVALALSPTLVVSATKHGVREHAAFDAYWGPHFVGARRVTG